MAESTWAAWLIWGPITAILATYFCVLWDAARARRAAAIDDLQRQKHAAREKSPHQPRRAA